MLDKERDDVECKSYYDETRCHNKCGKKECPGLFAGKCLSKTGLGQPAPPENFLDDSQVNYPEVVNLAHQSTTKGAYM